MSQERAVPTLNGWVMLCVEIVIFCGGGALLWLFIHAAIEADRMKTEPNFWLLVGSVLAIALGDSCAEAISLFSRTRGAC